MKAKFKLKWLQYLLAKAQSKGFGTIDFLALIAIALITALTLPSVLIQKGCACSKQPEASANVVALNRAQADN